MNDLDDATRTRIQDLVDGKDVVLFMKGTKHFPQCGFSQRVASLLNFAKVDFADVNVLADAEIRDGVKQFTNWPTIPQLYVKGEFVGGCDIVMEMAASGELGETLEAKGVGFDSAALEDVRAQLS